MVSDLCAISGSGKAGSSYAVRCVAAQMGGVEKRFHVGFAAEKTLKL